MERKCCEILRYFKYNTNDQNNFRDESCGLCGCVEEYFYGAKCRFDEDKCSCEYVYCETCRNLICKRRIENMDL